VNAPTAQTMLAAFPRLARLEPEARTLLAGMAQSVAVPAGTVLFRPGEACARFVMLRRGAVRVQMLSDTGHEIVLYRVRGGETCVLTTSCLIAQEPYGAEGIAESDVEALLVPVDGFERLMALSAVFRGFVLAAFGERMAELMHRLDQVAFRSIDARLAMRLLDAAQADAGIETTHQALAVELGTAREVVSRRLKQLERRGLVALARGSIAICDRDGLRRVAADAGSGEAE
jgi:CRP/FNR family transcriptional regulator